MFIWIYVFINNNILHFFKWAWIYIHTCLILGPSHKKKDLSIQDTSHVILKDSQSKSVTTLEVWHWGPRWFGKNRTPNPENLQQKVGYLFSKGNPSRSFPKIGFFSKKSFSRCHDVQVRKEGTNLGPDQSTDWIIQVTQKRHHLYTHTFLKCVFFQVFFQVSIFQWWMMSCWPQPKKIIAKHSPLGMLN